MGRTIIAAGLALAVVPAAMPAPLLAQAQVASPASDAGAQIRLALAREIVEISMPPATREATFIKIAEQMSGQMRDAMLRNIEVDDKQAVAILDRWIARWLEDSKPTLRHHIPALMEGWAAAYADIYSERELTDIKAFVATPSGAAFLQKMQDAIANPQFAAANQAYMNDVMARLPEAQAELVAELKAHLAKRKSGG